MFFVSSLSLYILNTAKGNYPTSGLEQAEYPWLLLPREILTIAVETFIILP